MLLLLVGGWVDEMQSKNYEERSLGYAREWITNKKIQAVEEVQVQVK